MRPHLRRRHRALAMLLPSPHRLSPALNRLRPAIRVIPTRPRRPRRTSSRNTTRTRTRSRKITAATMAIKATIRDMTGTTSRGCRSLSRHRRCRYMTSPPAPAPTICGLPAIGIGLPPGITGCRACGCWHRLSARYGLPAIGDGGMDITASIAATGVRTSASTAALITVTATMAAAIGAAAGIVASLTTTVLSPM